jgi:hypothetical protein
MNIEQPQPPAYQRSPLLPEHVTIEDLRHLLGAPGKPVSERGIYNELDRLRVPYVKVMNIRRYKINDVRAAILDREVTRQPRRPGRPAGRKAA